MLRRLIRRFYPTPSRTVTINGLDASGKTTLLYLMRLNEIVTTISTIGFNVEQVDDVTFWDMGGGCSTTYMRRVAAVYTEKADAMIWTVDSKDHERFQEAVETLKEILDGLEQARGDKNIPILVLATKQDLPGTMSIDSIRKGYASVVSGWVAFVFGVSLTRGMNEGGVSDALSWLHLTMDGAQNKTGDLTIGSKNTQRPVTPELLSLEDKVESWLTRASSDSSPGDFLSQLDDCSLPSWDHYTHIRLAFVVLMTHGRQKGKDIIFEGIRKYIEHNAQAQARTKYHVTMTYFWIQIVHFGIQALTSVSPESGSDSFSRFLLLNPYVADGRLWAQYYSQDKMMSPEAKTHMVLPDKRALPSQLVRDSVITESS